MAVTGTHQFATGISTGYQQGGPVPDDEDDTDTVSPTAPAAAPAIPSGYAAAAPMVQPPAPSAPASDPDAGEEDQEQPQQQPQQPRAKAPAKMRAPKMKKMRGARRGRRARIGFQQGGEVGDQSNYSNYAGLMSARANPSVWARGGYVRGYQDGGDVTDDQSSSGFFPDYWTKEDVDRAISQMDGQDKTRSKSSADTTAGVDQPYDNWPPSGQDQYLPPNPEFAAQDRGPGGPPGYFTQLSPSGQPIRSQMPATYVPRHRLFAALSGYQDGGPVEDDQYPTADPAPELGAGEQALSDTDHVRNAHQNLLDWYSSPDHPTGLQGMLQGDDAMHPDEMSARLAAYSDANPDHGHNEAIQGSIADAMRNGDIAGAAAMLQNARQTHDGMRAVGLSALENGNPDGAAHALTVANKHLPDGNTTTFTANPDGTYTAHVRGEDGQGTTFNLSHDQMWQHAHGLSGQFDHALVNGVHSNMGTLTQQGAQPAPVQTGYGGAQSIAPQGAQPAQPFDVGQAPLTSQKEQGRVYAPDTVRGDRLIPTGTEARTREAFKQSLIPERNGYYSDFDGNRYFESPTGEMVPVSPRNVVRNLTAPVQQPAAPTGPGAVQYSTSTPGGPRLGIPLVRDQAGQVVGARTTEGAPAQRVAPEQQARPAAPAAPAPEQEAAAARTALTGRGYTQAQADDLIQTAQAKGISPVQFAEATRRGGETGYRAAGNYAYNPQTGQYDRPITDVYQFQKDALERARGVHAAMHPEEQQPIAPPGSLVPADLKGKDRNDAIKNDIERYKEEVAARTGPKAKGKQQDLTATEAQTLQAAERYRSANQEVPKDLAAEEADIYRDMRARRTGRTPGAMVTAPTGGGGAPVRVSSPADARKLPSGTRIILPDGSPGIVP